MLVLSIVSLRRRKLAAVKCARATYGSVTPNTKFTFFCRIHKKHELAREN